jgi:hypothetical protein
MGRRSGEEGDKSEKLSDTDAGTHSCATVLQEQPGTRAHSPTCQGAWRAVHGHSSDEPQASLAANEQLLQIITAQAAGEAE